VLNLSGTRRRISAGEIEDARSRVSSEFLDSRQVENDELSRVVGVQVICKIEGENPVGSFKGRGADSLVNGLPAGVKALVTASAGNFGLALAYAGRRRGIEVTVFAAETASLHKLERIRSVGGVVKLLGRDFDEAKDHARAFADQRNVMYIEDGREPAIAAGAGTIAMEITGRARPIDTMLVPLGNGALLAGIGCWFRAHSPGTRIVGVCAEGAPAMAQSWRTHTVCSTSGVDTIADGIAVRVPVPQALADLEGVVDDIVLVSDEAMKKAMHLVYQNLGLIAEPSGVAGLAALMSRSVFVRGLVCTPLTGGNVTQDQLLGWIAEPE
jgi:threonine dehydratase